MSNPYDQPEDFGLTIVDLAWYHQDGYEWEFRIVWKHEESGQFYTGRDGGCSCNEPFERVTSLSELEQFSEPAVFAEIRDELGMTEAIEFMRTVQDARLRPPVDTEAIVQQRLEKEAEKERERERQRQLYRLEQHILVAHIDHAHHFSGYNVTFRGPFVGTWSRSMWEGVELSATREVPNLDTIYFLPYTLSSKEISEFVKEREPV